MQLYSEQYSWRPEIDGLSSQAIGVDEGSQLESDFEESEVLRWLKI